MADPRRVTIANSGSNPIMSTNMNLNICQHNLQRSQIAQDMCNLDNADIFFIQEPYTGNSGKVKAPGRVVYQWAKGSKESPCKSAIILNRNCPRGTLLANYTDANSVFVSIQLEYTSNLLAILHKSSTN
jgi:hypothetical protein